MKYFLLNLFSSPYQYGGLRKGLLGVYTIVLALFVVVLILLVVLAPIEKLFG